jgi:uncharacterized protein YegL
MMPNSLPLILRTAPVQRGFSPAQGRDPHVAAVYSTAAGDVLYFEGKPLTWSQKFLTDCRVRHDVDLRDLRHTAEMRSYPLRSVEGCHFIATVTVSFRVHDPQEVVRRGINDALPVIYGFLAGRFEAITRQCEIGESSRAELGIRQEFAAEVLLRDGITIFEVVPRLRPDEASSRYLQERTAKERALHSDAAQHRLDVQQQLHKAQLDGMTQAAQLKARENERRAMAARPMTALEMAHEHLARHPEDTEKVMGLFLEHERAVLERQDERARENTEFIKFMMQSDVVQPGIFHNFVEAAAQQAGIGGPAGAIGAPGAGSWNQPAVLPRPGAPAAAATGAPAAEAKPKPVVLEQDPASKVWAPSDGVQPLYILVDESSGASAHLDAITAGLGQVIESLRSAPEISPALRLSVLGFADQTMTRLAMGAVDVRSQLGWMTSRGGASYANAFETLYSRITPDVDGLKQQQLSVRRPLVFVLSASTPVDQGVWRTPYDRLVDAASHRYAPKIMACGVAEAGAELIAEIATQPETAYVMVPGTDVKTAIENYWQTLTRCLIDYGRSLIGGQPDFKFKLPQGFRLAREAD